MTALAQLLAVLTQRDRTMLSQRRSTPVYVLRSSLAARRNRLMVYQRPTTTPCIQLTMVRAHFQAARTPLLPIIAGLPRLHGQVHAFITLEDAACPKAQRTKARHMLCIKIAVSPQAAWIRVRLILTAVQPHIRKALASTRSWDALIRAR